MKMKIKKMKKICVQNEKRLCHAPLIFKSEFNIFYLKKVWSKQRKWSLVCKLVLT